MTTTKTKICCIGAGYIGGTTMAVLADQCPALDIVVTDASASKIDAWKSATSEEDLPIYEPGLWEILQQRTKNLNFTTDTAQAIADADIVFLAVHAPTKVSGVGKQHATDIVHCEATARLIAKHATSSKIVVEKGTFPVATAQAIERVLSYNAHGVTHHVLSNPDFFSQGSAVEDLKNPSRVLIGGGGGTSPEALQSLVEIYATWVPKEKILTPASTTSAELAKLVANALLAQRISSINSISQVCEMTGADVTQVSKAIGMDDRIGHQFLQAGLGFGKPRFRKDILSLVYLCEQHGLSECAEYWQHVVAMNECQRQRFSHKILEKMFKTVTGKKLAMLGYAFKKNTSDVRETPPMYILEDLLQEDAIVHVYDPKVKRVDMLKELDVTCGVNYETTPNLDTSVVTADDPYQACRDAHALLVLTDWEEFKNYDYEKVYEMMAKPAFVFDGRNLLDHKRLRDIGFEVHGIGRAADDDLLQTM